MMECRYYEKLDNNHLICLLCPHSCKIKPDNIGICKQRKNENGELVSLNHSKCSSVAIDPIEKKPLYHFHPNSNILSIGSNGCNFQCAFCQNWSISQFDAPTRDISPDEVIRLAKESHFSDNSCGIAYTYNEPIIWFEYIMDIAPQIKKAGLQNVMVSNGFINPKPLNELLEYIDAFNIDLKSMNPKFYEKFCKAKLSPVLESCKSIKLKAHLELTCLIITNENDGVDDVQVLSSWIKEELGADTPLHLSAYYPSYKMDNKLTSPTVLLELCNVAKENLDFVYAGNIRSNEFSHSTCPNCNTRLISRSGYKTEIENINSDGLCCSCKTKLNFIF